MKRREVLLIVIVVLIVHLILIVLLNNLVAKTNDEKLSIARIEIYTEWFEAGRYVAQDGEAGVFILESVLSNANIAKLSTREDGIGDFKIIVPRASNRLIVVPILSGDSHISGAWGEYLKAREHLHLWTLENKYDFFIFMRADAPYSEIMKGILFLDVCYKAWAHNQVANHTEGDEPVSHVKREQLALEHILHPTLLAVGGELYMQLLEDAKSAFGVNMDEWLQQSSGQYKDALDIIFGEPLSPDEERIRSKLFQTQVAFEFIRQNYPYEFAEFAVQKMYEALKN